MELLNPKDIQYLVIHHTRNRNSIDEIRNLHVKINGWDEISYHYIIDKDGKITNTRDIIFKGAHSIGFNAKSLGIALIGNFDVEKPTQEQENALFSLLLDLTKEYNISIQNIIGHNKDPTTEKSCPGKNLDLNKIKSKIKAELQKQKLFK